MDEIRLGVVESKFADLIWQNEPVTTAELVKLCAERLNWKRTTAYTVLKRLCERGIFQMENSVVTSRISRREFDSMQSEKFVKDAFDGSLPAFIAAFTAHKSLTEEEIAEIKRMIDSCGKEER